MKARHPHLLTFGALALVMPASADVIYSNLQNIAIPATFDGLYLNVETGAWNTPSNLGAGVAGWDVNPFSGGKAFANSPDFQPVRSGTTSSSPILNLAAGVTVGSGSVFSTFVQGVGGQNPGQPGYGSSQMLTGSGGNFTAGTEGYLGFKLNGTNYGSMRVVLTNNTSGAMIKDWAYDTSGAAIKTGWIKTDIVSPTARTVTLNPGTSEAFTLGSQLADASGSISNSVLKTGDGTTVLSQTNTYTGATNVNAGKLLINGSTSTSSAVTVANGATLGGSGAIGGSVTVQTGGTFAPGNSIESIATGNLALLASATFAQEIDKSAALGLSGDLAATTGSLSITSGAILTLTELGTSGAWTGGDTITLIGYSTGTWNGGLFTYLGNTLNDDSTFTFSGIDWTFNYNDLTAGDNYNSDLSAFTGSARYVTMTAVPEPRAALLGGIGLLMLLRRRR